MTCKFKTIATAIFLSGSIYSGTAHAEGPSGPGLAAIIVIGVVNDAPDETTVKKKKILAAPVTGFVPFAGAALGARKVEDLEDGNSKIAAPKN